MAGLPAPHEGGEGGGGSAGDGLQAVLQQMCRRLDMLQRSVDGLTLSLRAVEETVCVQRKGMVFRLDQDELTEAESSFFKQGPAEATPSEGEEWWAADSPAAPQGLPGGQQGLAVSGPEEDAAEEEEAAELSEDVLNPLPRGCPPPDPSVCGSGDGTPVPRQSGGGLENLLCALLPQLRELEAERRRTGARRFGAAIRRAAEGAGGAARPALAPAAAPASARPPLAPRARAAKPAECAAAAVVARRAPRGGDGGRAAGLLLAVAWELLKHAPERGAGAWARQLLPPLAPASRAWAVAAACKQLEHHEEGARRSAAQAVARLAELNDERSREAARERLDHGEAGVRLAAVDAFARLSSRTGGVCNSEGAVRQVCMMLHDPDEGVRRQAVASLSRLAGRGDHYAVTEVLGCLESADPHVRVSALQALNEIADRGDESVVGELVPLVCKDASPKVREVAWLVLYQLVEEGSPHAISQAIACTGAEDPQVTRSALRAIACWAGRAGAGASGMPGDPHDRAVEAVAACLVDADDGVRAEAVQTLRGICGRGNAYAVTALLAFLKDPEPHVRLTTVRAIADLAERGDDTCIDALGELRTDQCAEVRQAVTGALCVLASGRGASPRP